MSAAIAMAPSPAPHDRPSFGGEAPPAAAPSSAAAPAASASVSPSVQRTTMTGTPNATAASAHQHHTSRTGSGSPKGQAHGAPKSSPPSASRNAGGPPRIIVKKEPGSPELSTSRHRPRRLDLSKNVNSTSPATARPYTARDGAALGIQEVGLACLSPGFVTQDPAMKEQVQRSMSVREQQRHLIEARLQQQSAKGDGSMDKDKDGAGGFAAKTPGMSRRNKAPPGLSIVAPSHEHFANERVIQSAPLGQTFTGMNNNPHPLTRHIENRPSKLSNTSHIHHVPANQTNNRLPPISDVFGQQLSAHPASQEHSMYAQPSAAPRPMGSPPHSQHQPPPPSARLREYKSAEEAQHELAGGRPELLPKLVHYGGHQPPTPPSPLPGTHRPEATRSHSATKRRRDEYEAGVSPPLGNGRPAVRRGPFGEGRDSPDTQRAKRDEFLRLCERAWDLFHS